jgi:hypothetical protein
MNGLDRAMQAHISKMYATFRQSGSQPDMHSQEWYLMWNLLPDILGGLESLNQVYSQGVLSVYQSVLTIQIIGLVLSLILMVVFYVFMLAPFISELKRCRQRISLLLSQLPFSIDVEGLVKTAVMSTVSPNNAANDTVEDGKSSLARVSSFASSMGGGSSNNISF